MTGETIAWTVLALGVAAQVASLLAVAWRIAAGRSRPDATRITPDIAPEVSLVVPLCGLEPDLARCLSSVLAQRYRDLEILFCVADPADPAATLARRLLSEHAPARARVLVGDDPVTGNPKLDNLLKGWSAARGTWVIMADSNQLLPPDYVETVLAAWRPGCGMVSSPAWGGEPRCFAARLEAAFLNTHQARWQLAADQVGLGFAQGKTLAFPRAVLDSAGGPAVLGSEIAEDLAATKLVRGMGLSVRLTPMPFQQPLGVRTWSQVWGRQRRWAHIRRAGFPAIYAAEILTGAALPLAALGWLVGAGALPPWLLAALPLAWYGGEWRLARAAGWPSAASDVAAMILRDALMPVLWVQGWTSRAVRWRGTAVTSGARAAAGR